LAVRRALIGGICVLLAGWLTSADGQTGARPFYPGAPVNLQNVPINTTNALKGSSFVSSMGSSTSKSAMTNFNFTSFFPKITTPSWPPKTGQAASVLPQSQNVFQPNPIKGRGPFDGAKKATTGGIFGN
jgi:hypothetical protein